MAAKMIIFSSFLHTTPPARLRTCDRGEKFYFSIATTVQSVETGEAIPDRIGDCKPLAGVTSPKRALSSLFSFFSARI
jgi:hypothetical protein